MSTENDYDLLAYEPENVALTVITALMLSASVFSVAFAVVPLFATPVIVRFAAATIGLALMLMAIFFRCDDMMRELRNHYRAIVRKVLSEGFPAVQETEQPG